MAKNSHNQGRFKVKPSRETRWLPTVLEEYQVGAAPGGAPRRWVQDRDIGGGGKADLNGPASQGRLDQAMTPAKETGPAVQATIV